MKTFSLKVLLPLVLIFTTVSCSMDPLESMSSGAEPTDNTKAAIKYDYSTSELELGKLINDFRISKGLNALNFSDYVSKKAEEHNLYMIQNNDVSHSGFKERSDDIEKKLGAKKVNECIAYDFDTPQSALNAWLASSEHKDDFTGKFTHFGISIRVKPADGTKYYTVIFIAL